MTPPLPPSDGSTPLRADGFLRVSLEEEQPYAWERTVRLANGALFIELTQTPAMVGQNVYGEFVCDDCYQKIMAAVPQPEKKP